MLYTFVPEQRAWARLVGPQWRHLFATVPGIDPGQEYFPTPAAPSRLVGRYRDGEYEAIADPPGEFRVMARTRAARYTVQAPTDMGNVSRRVPSIHPLVAVPPPEVSLHTAEFARWATSREAERAVVDGARALAMTAVDVWCGEGVAEDIRAAFDPAP